MEKKQTHNGGHVKEAESTIIGYRSAIGELYAIYDKEEDFHHVEISYISSMLTQCGKRSKQEGEAIARYIIC